MDLTVIDVCPAPVVGGPVSSMVTILIQALISAHCALTTPSTLPVDFGPTALANGLQDYDFIIIGGGTSGATIASRLSENPNWTVLVLENGGDPTSESEVPSLFLTTHRSQIAEGYYTEPYPNSCLGMATGTCYLPVGRSVGGLSSIDAMLSFRGNKAKFEEWNLPNWDWREVTKYYDFSERPSMSSALPTGRLINNDIPQYYDSCHVTDMIFAGGEELGVRKLANGVKSNDRVGYGFMQGHVENGQRMGAGKSYLSVVKARTNIDIIKNALVKKINFGTVTRNKSTKVSRSDSLIAQSVTFDLGGTEITVSVKKEIIIASGAVNTAQLLMLSGIGPQSELTANNIPVLLDLPGVGQNLQDQIGVPIFFQIKKSTAKSKTAEQSQIDTLYYLTDKYGPLSTIGITALGGYINSDPQCRFKNCRYPDISIYHFFSQRNDVVLQMWYDAVGYNPLIKQSLAAANRDAHVLLALVTLQDPRSTGYIELQSNSPTDPAKLFANFLSDTDDVDSLLQGVKFEMELEQTHAYKKARAEILKLDIPECNAFVFKSTDYWRCYIKYMATSGDALSGTTKMGLDADPLAVVDLQLRVRGVASLRIIGSSVYPTTVFSSNTAVMVAERLAVFIRQDWPTR